MSNKKEKIFDICLILGFIAIFCTSNIFIKTISDLDELWNYNFANNISKGLIPYNDFNIITTPLLPMICGFVLKIFGNQLIVMRVLAVLLLTAIFYLMYKIVDKLTNNRVAKIMLIFELLLFKDVMCIDYNFAILLIALILVYFETFNEKKIFEYDFKYDILCGIIAGIAILFKQSTGICIAVACISYKMLAIRRKENIETFIKIFLTRLLGCAIPVLIFVVYLLFNNAFGNFLDYAILGIKTFSNKISYWDLLEKKFINILIIVVPITIMFLFVLSLRKEVKKESLILFSYSISSFVVTFPISDKIHFLIGSLISVISAIYIFYIFFNKIISKKKIRIFLYSIATFFITFMMLAMLVSSVDKVLKKYVYINKESELEHFYGIPEDVGIKKRINVIDNYIEEKQKEGKKVYVLDVEACIYMIPLNRYNKDYDLFTKGNLGAKGEDGIIDRIKNEENAIYLVKKDNINWQNPENVRKYIMNNLNHIGNISIFYIYEK